MVEESMQQDNGLSPFPRQSVRSGGAKRAPSPSEARALDLSALQQQKMMDLNRTVIPTAQRDSSKEPAAALNKSDINIRKKLKKKLMKSKSIKRFSARGSNRDNSKRSKEEKKLARSKNFALNTLTMTSPGSGKKDSKKEKSNRHSKASTSGSQN